MTPPLHAQIVVKGGDDVSLRLGLLAQPQAQWTEDASGGNAQDLFIRRLRILLGGQISKNFSFFVETDSPNLGKTAGGKKNTSQNVYLQDAFVSYKFTPAAIVDAGLILIPMSRNGLQSAASLLPIDYGTYTFTQNAATQSIVGRDTGVQLRGNLAANHFEYRVGVFQGARDAASHNGFRSAGRVQYDVWEAESGFFYTGTYLGKKKVLAFGAGYDIQDDYSAWDGDAFMDLPTPGGAFTGQLDYMHFDGGTFLTSIKKQNDVLAELGYLIRSAKLTPLVQYTRRDVTGGDAGDESRMSAGAAYWLSGHNANVKALYTRISPGVGSDTNQFSVQLQLFYY